jgi:predicted aspartyl protease
MMRLALAVLCASFVLPLPAGADILPTAAELAAKADAAEGPAPTNYRETILGTGTLGDIKTVTYHAGDDVRRTSDRDRYHSESGTYHGERWRQDYNGLALITPPDPGNAVKDTYTTTVRHVTQPFDAYVVAELNSRSAGMRTYFDSTGTVVTTIDDFGQFGSRTLAAHWTVTSSEYHAEMHYQRTAYAVDTTTDTDVREAATERLLVDFPAGVHTVDLPVQLQDHYFYVRVNIGARGYDFVLDTGASGIFIDPDAARSAGLTLTNATSEVIAQRITAYDTIIPEMRIGALRMHDIAAEVAPMPPWGNSTIKPVGLLGFDFLAQLGVTLDYKRGSVHVVSAAEFVPPADPSTYTFDVRLGSGQPTLTVEVNGAVAERVICDTGWGGSLAFFDYFARRYPRAFSSDLGPGGGYGVGGRFIAERYSFHDVKAGQLHFEDFPGLRIAPENYPQNTDGLIGNNLLSLFTVTLDYAEGRMYLTPTDDTKRMMHSR